MVFKIKRKTFEELFFTGSNQIWKIISGFLTVILIPLYLTSELQGYWFTIIGLSLLMIFADLGFSTIILQFAAHEYAHLKIEKNGKISGSREHLKKLATFFVFSVKWAVFIILAAVPIVALVSFFILMKKHTQIQWFLPWFMYLIASVLIFLNNMMLCFFEGCDMVPLIQRMRMQISIVMALVVWGGLIFGQGLYALGFSALIGSLYGSAIIYSRFIKTIIFLVEISRDHVYSWRREFFSLLWKYAISWASGYFIFQIYTPLMFYFNGAVEAGKIGLSIALWSAVYGISLVWVTSVTPRINMHISKKEWKKLDDLFFKRMFMSALTFVVGVVAVFVLFGFVLKGFNIMDRLSDKTSLVILAAAWFLQVIINSMAVFLRSHKEELLVLPSFLSAVYILITTYLCAIYLPKEYFFLGFLSSYIWGLPWALIIFIKRRSMHLLAE